MNICFAFLNDLDVIKQGINKLSTRLVQTVRISLINTFPSYGGKLRSLLAYLLAYLLACTLMFQTALADSLLLNFRNPF